jgi:FAD/FMN-containing dehydrogenase
MQAGKSYPYLRGRQPAATQALEEIKRHLDPNTLMNPGALDGLNVNQKG